MKRFWLVVLVGISLVGCVKAPSVYSPSADLDQSPQVEVKESVEKIVADKSDQQICFYWTSNQVECFPAFFGAPDTPTPEGLFDADRWDPVFYNPDGSGDIIHTPMLFFTYPYNIDGKKSGYGIHGSPNIGANVSMGCIRVGFDTAEYLMSLVNLGYVTVRTVHASEKHDITRFYVQSQDSSPTRIVVQQ